MRKLRPHDQVVMDGQLMTVVRRQNLKLFTVVVFRSADGWKRVLLPESHLWHLRLMRRLVDVPPDLVSRKSPVTIH